MKIPCEAPAISSEQLASLPTAPLLKYRPLVLQARSRFFQLIRGFPSPLDAIAIAHYEQRRAEAAGRLLWCEYAPWIAADLVGLSEEKRGRALIDFAPGWLALYAYTLVTDDIIDNSNLEHRRPLVLVSGLLQDLAIRSFQALEAGCPASHGLVSSVSKSLYCMAQAASDELSQHRFRLSRFDEDKIDQLGSKIAGLNVCIDFAARLNGAEPRVEIFEAARFLAAGLQLLDDITDLEADRIDGNCTFPLTLTLQEMTVGGAGQDQLALLHELSIEELRVALIATGSLERTLALSASMIGRGLDKILTSTQAPSILCFKLLADELRSQSVRVRSLREGFDFGRPCTEIYDVRRLVQRSDVMSATESTWQMLRIVAQSS